MFIGSLAAARALTRSSATSAYRWICPWLFRSGVYRRPCLLGEAITDTQIVVVKRSASIALAGRDATIAPLTGRELRRMRERMLLLVKSAQERVAGFLLEIRQSALASATSRRAADVTPYIADYLGLTIETVSRTFTGLETAATIAVPASRRIVLRNRSALRHLNG